MKVQAVHVGWQIAVETDHRALTAFVQRDVSLRLDLNSNRNTMPNMYASWAPVFLPLILNTCSSATRATTDMYTYIAKRKTLVSQRTDLDRAVRHIHEFDESFHDDVTENRPFPTVGKRICQAAGHWNEVSEKNCINLPSSTRINTSSINRKDC